MTITAQAATPSHDAIAASIDIPAQPQLLKSVQLELQKAEPDPRVVSAAIVKDVAMSAALVRLANSAAFAGKRQIDSVAQALAYIGLRQTTALLTALLLRSAPQFSGPQMPRFWDSATKRAMAMQYLARKTYTAEQDVAYTCGLFCDIGIALMTRKFDTYQSTLMYANGAQNEPFLQVEESRHGTNHAVVGAMMARAWGLSDTVIKAIRIHHDYDAFNDSTVEPAVRELAALLLLADRVVHSFRGLNKTVEWEKGGAQALEALMMTNSQFEELSEAIHELFEDESPE